jgi:hypothetical protein
MKYVVEVYKHYAIFFYSIQIIVAGTTAEVEDMLNKYGDSYDSRKSLATFVSVLKR